MKRIATAYHKILQLQRDGLQRKPASVEDSPEHVCLNCRTHYHGSHCPACGQAASTQRFTLKDMLHSIFATFIAGDSIFFRTSTALLFRPGHMVRDYLYGRRIGYFKPVLMLVRLVAIFVLLSYIFDREYSVTTLISSDLLTEHVHSETLAQAIAILTSLLNNKAIYSLLLSFISVLPFKLAFVGCRYERPDGSRVGLNIAEHYITLVYLSCLNLIISILVTPFSSIGTVGTTFNGLTFPLLLALSSTIYGQLFGIRFWNSLLRSLLAIIFTLLFTASLIIFAFGIFYGIDAVK